MTTVRWWVKSMAQASLACMPYGESLNHQLQKWNGYRRRLPWAVGNNVRHLGNLVMTARKFGLSMEGASVVEVGTGWTPTLPVGASLLGAEVHTYDHLPHLRAANLKSLLEMYPDFLTQLSDHVGVDLGLLQARIANLRHAERVPMRDWLGEAGIHYCAPGDAAQTGLGANSVDLYFSIAVFEHISENDVRRMVREAQRILKPGGLTYHHIGLHDHLAETDAAATKINFLKFADWTWRILGQNRIQFHNRLRRSEFIKIFQEENFEILECESEVDEASLRALSKMRVSKKYQRFDREDLATYVMTICCRKKASHLA